MSKSAVLVGLFDGYMNVKDDCAPLETKIGGRPTYPITFTPELQTQIHTFTHCQVCGKPMFLLLQAYSPLQSIACNTSHESKHVERRTSEEEKMMEQEEQEEEYNMKEATKVHLTMTQDENDNNADIAELATLKEKQELNNENDNAKQETSLDKCNKPNDEYIKHHRMLYVFCCNSASCIRQPLRSWNAFSLQVDDDNNKEEEEKIEEQQEELEEIEEEEKRKDDLINVNEINEEPLPLSQLAPHSFPPCFVFVEDEPSESSVPLTSVEQELLRKAEANKASLSAEDQRELEQVAQIVERGHDYYYDKFRHRLERARTQVIRYYPADVHLDPSWNYYNTTTTTTTTTTRTITQIRSTNRQERKDNNTYDQKDKMEEEERQWEKKKWVLRKRDKPLFMNPPLVARGTVVPPCTECGGPRIHELQIMPTALFYLRVEDYVEQQTSNENSANNSTTNNNNNNSTSVYSSNMVGTRMDGVDFGTVTLYTCAHECSKHKRGVYLHKEFLCVEEAPPVHLPSQVEEYELEEFEEQEQEEESE